MCLMSVLLVSTLPEYSIVILCGSTLCSSWSLLFRSLTLSVVSTETRMSFGRVVSLTLTMKLTPVGGVWGVVSPSSVERCATLCRRRGEDCVAEFSSSVAGVSDS